MKFILRVVLKGTFLFILCALIFSFLNPLPALGRVSAYNHIFPGRVRLPYGDNPQRAYNLSLFNVEAMFASHEISSGQKSRGEFRVLLIGDSATWGFFLQPDETSSAFINAAGTRLLDGRQLRTYNLGYPVMSLAKDLLIFSYAMRYQPDLIVWLITLESFPYDKQLYPPLVQNNPEEMRKLIWNYHLNLNPDDPGFIHPTLIQRSLIGQRRALADLLRLQLYGFLWAATGIDQDIPEEIPHRMEDLPVDSSFHSLQPPLRTQDLAFDILQAGVDLAGKTPVLIINEPMFISQGENSDIRYNFFYPRWAYDEYRRLLSDECTHHSWLCRDYGDAIIPEEFTNTAIHMTPAGSARFADLVRKAILEAVDEK